MDERNSLEQELYRQGKTIVYVLAALDIAAALFVCGRGGWYILAGVVEVLLVVALCKGVRWVRYLYGVCSVISVCYLAFLWIQVLPMNPPGFIHLVFGTVVTFQTARFVLLFFNQKVSAFFDSQVNRNHEEIPGDDFVKSAANINTGKLVLGAVSGAALGSAIKIIFSISMLTLACTLMGTSLYELEPSSLSMAFSIMAALNMMYNFSFILVAIIMTVGLTSNKVNNWADRAVKYSLISLSVAAIAIFIFRYGATSAASQIGPVGEVLTSSFDAAIIGLMLGFLVGGMKDYPIGKVKIALTGMGSGWLGGIVYYLIYKNVTSGELVAKVLSFIRMPLVVACVGVAILLVEKHVIRKCQELETEIKDQRVEYKEV